MSLINLLIITPLLPPAVGGAGVYTLLLVQGLLKKTEINQIVIITEAYPGFPVEEVLYNGKLCIKRLFPYRAGVPKKDKLRYVKYAYQNFQFFLACLIAYRYKITHVLIHSSFHNNFSLMGIVVKALKKLSKVQVVADVRDLDLLPGKLYKLYFYDKVVCCSQNVYSCLTQDGRLKHKTVLIPVIIDLKVPTSQEINYCKRKYNLYQKDYIINNSGISKEKGIDLLLEVIAKMREAGEDITLVVAGKKRDWSSSHQVAVDSGLLIYLGPIPHEDSLCLSAGARLDVNLSKVDSMPRASLEAVAVGARVVLPQGVPEFTRSCSNYIAVSNSPDELAVQAIRILRQEHYYLDYDINAHSLEKVIPEYVQLLN